MKDQAHLCSKVHWSASRHCWARSLGREGIAGPRTRSPPQHFLAPSMDKMCPGAMLDAGIHTTMHASRAHSSPEGRQEIPPPRLRKALWVKESQGDNSHKRKYPKGHLGEQEQKPSCRAHRSTGCHGVGHDSTDPTPTRMNRYPMTATSSLPTRETSPGPSLCKARLSSTGKTQPRPSRSCPAGQALRGARP